MVTQEAKDLGGELRIWKEEDVLLARTSWEGASALLWVEQAGKGAAENWTP